MPVTIDFDSIALDELQELLAHDDPYLRADAACAIGDRLRTREIESLAPPVLQQVGALLADREVAPRVEAAITLAELHDHRATPVLLAALRSRTFRLDAIRALATLGDRSAVPALVLILDRFLMPWADKLQAAAALCALGDPRGQRYLLERVHSRRFPERAATLHFLAEARHPAALTELCKVAADPRDSARDVAVRALGTLRDRAALPTLDAVRHDADPELGADVEAAIAAIAPRRR
ncbi:MAG: hypothetical protein HY903_16980 [Deltaproteobacteria bacterium]|nr:hypothetical protein [Deltaproteobacteria bacterium]